MNFTELARKLNVAPSELREILPKVGFNIGNRAIKVDKRIARKIIDSWPSLIRNYKEIRRQEKEALKQESDLQVLNKEVKIPELITIRDLAAHMEIPVKRLIEELMKNGIFASLNERIDYETAAIVAMSLGFKVKKNENLEVDEMSHKKLEKIIQNQKEGTDLYERPPVIVVMGHVDHGKTKLLDTIRTANIISGEAGGITQHIGAYQVIKNDRPITFIDTPGHEAFTAMRGRGARVADLAILVIAADDGIKPQTIEALKIIENVKLPYIIAINKIDKDGADIDKVKRELSEHNVLVEDWGGKIIAVPISAKEGTGIDNLLEMILLVSDIDKERLMVGRGGPAVGTVIESRVDKSEGNLATILIQSGNLKKGDSVIINNFYSGKARQLRNYKGEEIEEAAPSTPVKIIGLKNIAHIGDIMEVAGEDEKLKFKKYKKKFESTSKSPLIKIKEQDDDEDEVKKLNILIKADVLGSTEVILETIEKIAIEDIKVKPINRGLGNIVESDILAVSANNSHEKEGTKTIIIGFNVKLASAAQSIAKEKNVNVKIYTVIYHLMEDVKKILEEMAGIDIVQEEIGRLKILKIFRSEKDSMIVGGKVISGNIKKNSKVEVLLEEEPIANQEILELQSGKTEVKMVPNGEECGLKLKGKPVMQEGSILRFFEEKKVKRNVQV